MQQVGIFRGTKLEAKVKSCLAFLHGYIQGGLAMTGPCLDNFIHASEEESLLRLIVVEVHFDLLK